jgi:pyruvate/2-oxoglutarate dehydrogenase complex dihydrolipoamide acyltransferase (E2) component
MTVSFSAAFRGTSTYFTTDEQLAEKIRSHRWFREGRITEVKESPKEQEETKEETAAAAAPAKTEVKYSVMGQRFVRATAQPTVKEETTPEPEEETPEDEATEDEAEETPSAELNADDVTTFMEAKEYLMDAYGIERSAIRTKEAMAEVCREKGITFNNYDLGV